MGIIVTAIWIILFCLSLIIPVFRTAGVEVGVAVVGIVAAILLLTGK